ncbi:MAG: GTPase, partial [Candidatus Bathyarchaeota archaeon]
PEETRNKKAEKLVRIFRKPLIFAVNKSDLITMKTVKKHRKNLENIAPCVFVSIKNRRGITFLKKKIFEIVKKRSRRNLIRIGVIGYPNTGKSSLINALAGRKKARVGAKPGWTRGVQWISGGPGIRLVDTPGVIPLVEEDEVKKALMYILDPSKISDPEVVAKKIVKMFLDQNKRNLEKLYGIEIKNKRFKSIIHEIGTVRNMLKKGGVIDTRRVYLSVINDWQKGRLLLKD